MAKIVTVDQMVAIEKEAVKAGLSYDQMMENAGQSVAQHILATWPEAAKSRILIVVGPGNNGGDGLVAGYFLAEAGADVSFYLLKDRDENDANYARVRAAKAQIVHMAEDPKFRLLKDQLQKSDILIDGLLGTGFKLPLRGEAQKLLRATKQFCDEIENELLVAAIDCPSGLDCDTGVAASECISADLTVTLAAVKVGLLELPAVALIGDVVVGDIGLGEIGLELDDIAMEMMDLSLAKAWLPRRSKISHKGTFGRTLIVAGSLPYPGAAVLAAKGAYRSGVGLVTLAVPGPIYQPLVGVMPEATWIQLPHEDGSIARGAVQELGEALSRSQSLLVGPGFGLHPQSQEFLQGLFQGENSGGQAQSQKSVRIGKDEVQLPPTVIDADVLKLLAKISGWHKLIPDQSVLTPHPGEMSVLTGLTVDQIQRDRIKVARDWAEKWGHIVVLKGAHSIVASPAGNVMVIAIASAALAKAGTGDVLAGVIASLIAQGMPPYKAAAFGAYLHARAGVLAAEIYGSTVSVLASDVANTLPEVFAELEV